MKRNRGSTVGSRAREPSTESRVREKRENRSLRVRKEDESIRREKDGDRESTNNDLTYDVASECIRAVVRFAFGGGAILVEY